MTDATLQRLISEKIQNIGPLTFAEYMRLALYEPGYGYYVSGPSRIGWQGDYYTSSDLSELFAHCLGRQLHHIWEQLGQPAPFLVLEQGAGRGNLAEQVQNWALRTHQSFSAVLTYRTEDIRNQQDALLSPIQSSQANPPFTPYHVIFSNELVDAFPVHVVEKQADRLYEVYVGLQGGRLCELLDEPSSPEVAAYLDTYKIPWQSHADGWRAEINLAADQWIARTAQKLSPPPSGGFLLTIDYGDTAQELYIRDRQHGTLASYYRHQFTERPLVRPGEQDITAHVNFSALIDEGRRSGLQFESFTTQRQWLTDMGIHEELARIRAQEYAVIDSERATDRGQVALLKWYNLRHRVAALTEPTGMGNFKVLLLKR